MVGMFRPAEVFHVSFALVAERVAAMLTRIGTKTIVAMAAMLVCAGSARADLIAQQDFDEHYTPDDWIYDDSDLYSPSSDNFTIWGSAAGMVIYTNTNVEGGLGGNAGWNTGITLEADTIYTVTVAFGERLDLASPGANFRLRDGYTGGGVGNNLATATYTHGDGLTAGSFIDHSLVLNTQTNTSLVGVTLWVLVEGNEQSSYDNFRVYSQSVPEPATSVLWLSAAGGLLAYAWRKRRS